MSLLEVHGLRAGYGAVNVLHEIELTVEPGEIVVMLGANGAGKTTTMRSISGTIGRQGTIVFDGDDITKLPAEQIVRLGIAQVPQGRGTFPELSVEENLRIGAYTRKDKEVGLDIDLWYETFPRLSERRGQRAGSLSGGEQQMLAIARALMCRPKLLLCDEPSLGLAPLITKELFNIIGGLNDRWGIAVLLVEQNANLAMHIAKRVYLLETGTIVATGDADDHRGRRQHPQGVPGLLTWTVLMDRFFEALFIGLSSGAIYALVALGIVVVFRGSGHLNFAQGEMATLSAYIAWLATTWTIPGLDSDIPLWAATILAMVFGFAIGAIRELLIVRPLGRRSPLAVFVALIAVFLGINAFDAGMWDAPPQETIGSLFPDEPDDFVRILGTTWRWENIGTLVVALVVSAVALPVVPEDEGRPGDEGGGQQHRVGQARRHPDELDPRRLVGTCRCPRGARRHDVRRAAGPGEPDPDVHRVRVCLGGRDVGRARQPDRRPRRRADDRDRRERGRRVRPRLDRPGD